MFKGLVTLITGGASGLGKATTEHFVKQGAKVVLCDISIDAGEKLAEELGPKAIFSHCDVTSEKDVIKTLKDCKEHFGGLDVLVNAAGTSISCPLYCQRTQVIHPFDDFLKIINVNLVGTFNTIRLSAPLFYKNQPINGNQRGLIINVASIAGTDGARGALAYAASKGAIVGMTLPIARDLATMGVRNVTIAPGAFDTPLYGSLKDKAKKHIESHIVFPKRLGRPSEFAKLVELIVENEMFNGETIRIDACTRIP